VDCAFQREISKREGFWLLSRPAEWLNDMDCSWNNPNIMRAVREVVVRGADWHRQAAMRTVPA
jgi:hypothetical protein